MSFVVSKGFIFRYVHTYILYFETYLTYAMLLSTLWRLIPYLLPLYMNVASAIFYMLPQSTVVIHVGEKF